jgi:hypothetical protein
MSVAVAAIATRRGVVAGDYWKALKPNILTIVYFICGVLLRRGSPPEVVTWYNRSDHWISDVYVVAFAASVVTLVVRRPALRWASVALAPLEIWVLGCLVLAVSAAISGESL